MAPDRPSNQDVLPSPAGGWTTTHPGDRCQARRRVRPVTEERRVTHRASQSPGDTRQWRHPPSADELERPSDDGYRWGPRIRWAGAAIACPIGRGLDPDISQIDPLDASKPARRLSEALPPHRAPEVSRRGDRRRHRARDRWVHSISGDVRHDSVPDGARSTHPRGPYLACCRPCRRGRSPRDPGSRDDPRSR